MENSKPFSTQNLLSDIVSPATLSHSASFFNCAGSLSFAALNLGKLKSKVASGEERAVPEHFLIKKELAKFETFKFDKRKIEWLGGRICAKISALALLKDDLQGHDWQSIWINPDKSGRPFITSIPHIKKIPDISISHSADLAACLAVHDHSCGLDLQKITPTVIKIKKRFCSRHEENLLKQNPIFHEPPQETIYTFLWAAKEAVRKSHPCQPLMGFLEMEMKSICIFVDNTFLAEFTCRREGLEFVQKVIIFPWKNFAGAITVN